MPRSCCRTSGCTSLGADMLAVRKGDNATHLMVFGHNPGITEFANRCRLASRSTTCRLRRVQRNLRHRRLA
jgi:hypothetical protein